MAGTVLGLLGLRCMADANSARVAGAGLLHAVRANQCGARSQIVRRQQTVPIAGRSSHKSRIADKLCTVREGQTRCLGVLVQPLRPRQPLLQGLFNGRRVLKYSQHLHHRQMTR